MPGEEHRRSWRRLKNSHNPEKFPKTCKDPNRAILYITNSVNHQNVECSTNRWNSNITIRHHYIWFRLGLKVLCPTVERAGTPIRQSQNVTSCPAQWCRIYCPLKLYRFRNTLAVASKRSLDRLCPLSTNFGTPLRHSKADVTFTAGTGDYWWLPKMVGKFIDRCLNFPTIYPGNK